LISEIEAPQKNLGGGEVWNLTTSRLFDTIFWRQITSLTNNQASIGNTSKEDKELKALEGSW